MTRTLRELSDQAAAKVQEAVEAAKLEAATDGGKCSAQSNYNSWTARLQAARQHREADSNPEKGGCSGGIFHHKTGLGAVQSLIHI